jgi:tRNA pseudouridine13 synthase
LIRFERPEDFRVEEVALYEPRGEGGHTFVCIEKRMRTSDEVARDLARAAGVKPSDVGYAGRKDRMSISRQWFSVPNLAPERAISLELRDAKVLAAAAHPHKLRTGHLEANRFTLVVRDIEPKALASAPERLARLVEVGLPNRFGGQRFGRDGGNAEQGRRILVGEARQRDRRRARFLVSALQAEVFNRVLAERLPDLVTLEAGDVAVVHESGGLFVVEDPEIEAARAAAFEISATGPIFGTKVIAPGGAVAERERRIALTAGVPGSLKPPKGIRLRGTRRPLRVRPRDAVIDVTGERLQLRFTLPPGSFATVLVEELLRLDG